MPSLMANSLAMLAARLIAPLFSLAVNIGIARYWGSETYGHYVQLVALLLIAQSAAGAGMSMLLTRELAAHPDNLTELLRRARTLVSISGVGATLLLLAYGWVFQPGQRFDWTLILALTVVPSGWITVQESLFVATRMHHRVTLVALAENGLKLLLAVAAFYADGGLGWLCAGIVIARLAALGLGQLLGRDQAGWRSWLPSVMRHTGMIRATLPFAALFTLSLVYFRVDVILLESLRGPHETGIYAAALALYSAALLVPDSAMSAVYPRLASAFAASPQGYARATTLSARIMAAMAVPLSAGLIALAPFLVGLLYGARFAGSVPALRLLAATLPIQAFNTAMGQALQAARLQGSALRVVITGVALHIALNLILIGRMGILGAPIALLISSSCVAILAARVFHRRIAPIAMDFRRVLTALALAAPTGVALAAPTGLWSFAMFLMSGAIFVSAAIRLIPEADSLIRAWWSGHQGAAST